MSYLGENIKIRLLPRVDHTYCGIYVQNSPVQTGPDWALGRSCMFAWPRPPPWLCSLGTSLWNIWTHCFLNEEEAG
jgi:hypothetical protein